jgi:glyceraldehyde 3-phosphate dehydrogenase
MTNVAINGLGRIGRATLKIVMDTPNLNLVAANDIGASHSVEYLLKYDTVYGRYEKPVQATDDGHLKIGDHRLTLLREKEPARLPWKTMNVDIVFECTGVFTRREDLDAHIRAGAAFVILSAPSKDDDVETIVHGVNTPQGDTTIISCASCTTNCITPVMEILGRRIGVKKGDHDYRSCVHCQPSGRRHCTQPPQKRSSRQRQSRTYIHWRSGGHREGVARVSR